jgi:hypothetical protein
MRRVGNQRILTNQVALLLSFLTRAALPQHSNMVEYNFKKQLQISKCSSTENDKRQVDVFIPVMRVLLN